MRDVKKYFHFEPQIITKPVTVLSLVRFFKNRVVYSDNQGFLVQMDRPGIPDITFEKVKMALFGISTWSEMSLW